MAKQSIEEQHEELAYSLGHRFAEERERHRERIALMEAEHRELLAGLRIEVMEMRAEHDRLVREIEALPARRLKAVT